MHVLTKHCLESYTLVDPHPLYVIFAFSVVFTSLLLLLDLSPFIRRGRGKIRHRELFQEVQRGACAPHCPQLLANVSGRDLLLDGVADSRGGQMQLCTFLPGDVGCWCRSPSDVPITVQRRGRQCKSPPAVPGGPVACQRRGRGPPRDHPMLVYFDGDRRPLKVP